MESSSYSEEYHSGNTAANASAANAANWTTWTVERKEGSRSFGLNAVAGADFYFADNFYLGVELGLGFQSTKLKDSEITVSDENAYLIAAPTGAGYVAATFDDMLTVENGKMKTLTQIGDGSGDYKDSNWGPNFQSTLRLGWLF
jgi:hypothetical protein